MYLRVAKISLAITAWMVAWLTLSLPDASLLAREKDKKSSKEQKDTAKFKVAVDLVTVVVMARDSSGKPITDLRREEIEVLEDGVKQEINDFRLVSIPSRSVIEQGPQTGPTPEPSADRTLKDITRRIIFFVDDVHTTHSNWAFARDAALKFIATQLLPTDYAAVITTTGRNSTEFTREHQLLPLVLNNIIPSIPASAGAGECPRLSEYQADQIVRFGESTNNRAFELAVQETIVCANLQDIPNATQIAQSIVLASARQRLAETGFASRQTLIALEKLNRRLKQIDGPKIILFLTDGFLIHDNWFEVSSVTDAAVRANAIVHSIDSRGLWTEPPGGDASTSTTPGVGSLGARFLGEKTLLRGEEISALSNVMNALAADTGGRLWHNTNDLLGSMKTAMEQSNYFYVATYYSSNPVHDGKFRSIRVKVNRPHIEVQARKGYFAPRGDAEWEARKNEEIREALRSAEDLRDIPVALSFSLSHGSGDQSELAVSTRIDVKKISFAKRESRNQNIFHIVTVVFDSNNRFVHGLEKRLDFSLLDPNYQTILDHGLVSRVVFRLNAGAYRVRTIVREAGEMRIGSATKTVEIEN